MSKNIVFCADGTWNGPGTVLTTLEIDSADGSGKLPPDAITNVVKLFANLAGHVTPDTVALRYEAEKLLDGLQIAKVLHGVGDSSNPILKVLGGVFGVGVIARILRGYTFLSRNYLPGDAIHILGFSRGAYTARARRFDRKRRPAQSRQLQR